MIEQKIGYFIFARYEFQNIISKSFKNLMHKKSHPKMTFVFSAPQPGLEPGT